MLETLLTLAKSTNIDIFQSLNTLAGTSPYWDTIIIKMADLPVITFPIFLLLLWFYAIPKDKTSWKSTALFAFFAVFISLLINIIIQQFIHLPRPETAIISTGTLLLDHLPNASFPSDHAAAGMAFALILLLRRFWIWGSIYFIFIIFMSISRIIAGIHWPIDILAGWIVGTIVAISMIYTTKYWEKHIWKPLYRIAKYFHL